MNKIDVISKQICATSLTRVALYIRVSTDRQAKEGDSLEAQEESLRKYAKEHNYIIVDVYIDGGESGQKLKRTNLQRMLKDVEDGKIDLVIMTKLDRWFRNVSDFYKVLDVLKRNNVNWKTIWEEYDTTTATGEFWLNVSLALGQMEAQRTGERINQVFDYKFKVQKTVCSGTKIFGYDISKEKKLIINEKEAKQLNLLFDKYIETNNLYETTRWFQSNVRSNAAITTIRKYLTNSAYIGKYKHVISKTKEIEIIENFSPAIIDNAKFNIVQDMLKVNVKNYFRIIESKNGNKRDYLFSGMIFCSCGRRMYGKNSRNKHYYLCKSSRTNLCNNRTQFSEKKLENYLIENIDNVIEETLRKYTIDQIEENSNIDDISKLINKIKNKLDKLSSLYIEDLIDIDYYKLEYSKLKDELSKLQEKENNEKKRDLSSLQNFLNNKNWKNLYDSLEVREKRRFWLSIIDKVIVYSKDDFEICLKLY